jgi:hypothetical protein
MPPISMERAATGGGRQPAAKTTGDKRHAMLGTDFCNKICQ